MKKSAKNITIISVVGLLVCAAALFVYAYHYKVGPFESSHPENTQPNRTTDYSEATKDQVTAGNQAKNDFENRETEASQQADGPSEPTNATVAVQISSARYMSEGGLSVRTIIQTIDNSGVCTLTVKQGETIVKKLDASTQSMGSYSTCEGFDTTIPEAKAGTLHIEIKYNGSGGSGTTTKEITI